MFAVSRGDALSFFLWEIALVGCICAATALLFRLGCEVKPKHVLILLGYVIPSSLNLILPFVPNTNQAWNTHGLIAASSLLLLNLAEAYFFLYHAWPVVRGLNPALQCFWVVANSILVPAPTIFSIILFSPISLSPLVRLVLVYLIPILVFLRSCLAAGAYTSIALITQHKDKQTVFGDSATVEQLDKESDIAKTYLFSRIAAKISGIESVILLAFTVSAKWSFGPYYVLLLGTITAYSRSYVAFYFYSKNSPVSMNTAKNNATNNSEGVRDSGEDNSEGVRDSGDNSEGVRDSGEDNSEGVRDSREDKENGGDIQIEVVPTITARGMPPTPPPTPT